MIAGRYSGTYTLPSASALDLGVMENPGYRIGFVPDWELIKDTDAFAAQVIETIWRGFSLVSIDCISKEYKQGPINAVLGQFSTYAPTGAVNMGTGVVGRRGTDLAGSVILSSTASTPAASTPASLTASLAQVREGYNVEWLFDSSARKAPMSFRLLPVTDGSTGARYWSAT